MTIEDIDRLVQKEVETEPGEGRLSCARARGLAHRLGVSPDEIGDALLRLDIRITDCQLGCFGSRRATPEELDNLQVSGVLIEEIDKSLVDGRLPCSSAFEIAEKLKTSPNQVGKAANRQKVKISGCQLGCFS